MFPIEFESVALAVVMLMNAVAVLVVLGAIATDRG